MTRLKSKKGITLITLVVTLIVMAILTTVTITSTYTGTDFRRYSLMCSDVELLEGLMEIYDANTAITLK